MMSPCLSKCIKNLFCFFYQTQSNAVCSIGSKKNVLFFTHLFETINQFCINAPLALSKMTVAQTFATFFIDKTYQSSSAISPVIFINGVVE